MLRHDLERESESQLDQICKTNWGRAWPAWRICSAMVEHDAFHGGIVGYLHDLYYRTHRDREG